MALQIIIGLKLYTLLKKLSDKNIKIRNWSAYAAKKDLKVVLHTTVDEDIKEVVIKILQGIKQRNWLFFGSIGLIFLIFFINGIFNLNL